MSHPDTATSGRTRPRRPWLVVAAVVWAVALLVPIVLGGGRLQHTLTGSRDTADPVVELVLAGDPTLTWTDVAKGTVSLPYELRLSGAPETDVTVTGGTATAKNPRIEGTPTTVHLEEGAPHRGTFEVPVTCTDRVKVGVHATGPIVGDAEVFTWVEPRKDKRGNIACTLI